MDDLIYVVPLTGRKIRDHQSGRELPEAGMTVTDSTFWRRRQRDGDVVISDGPPLPTKTIETNFSATAAPAVEENDA